VRRGRPAGPEPGHERDAAGHEREVEDDREADRRRVALGEAVHVAARDLHDGDHEDLHDEHGHERDEHGEERRPDRDAEPREPVVDLGLGLVEDDALGDLGPRRRPSGVLERRRHRPPSA
jgi:hypothetical protein